MSPSPLRRTGVAARLALESCFRHGLQAKDGRSPVAGPGKPVGPRSGTRWHGLRAVSDFTVVYDACVLYPAPLRSLLMYLVLTDLLVAPGETKEPSRA